MSTRNSLVISGAVGAIAGFVVAFFELDFVPSMVEWWGLGMLMGIFSKDRKDAVFSGGVYGGVLAMAFITFGIGVMSDGIIEYALLFFVMCLIGILNGAASELAGLEARQKVKIIEWLRRVWQLIHDRYEKLYSK